MPSLEEVYNFLSLHFYVQGYLMPYLTLKILLSGESDVAAGVKNIVDRTKTTFTAKRKRNKIESNCVYLLNHRSWADFFIDQSALGGAAYLSRKMVIVGTPMSALWAYLNNSSWFFKRKSGIDRMKFFDWIDENYTSRPGYGLIAYPEGTRNSSDSPKPLKSGVMHYAFNCKRKVQVIITTNKEHVVNEKKFSSKNGVNCYIEISKVLDPKDFKTFEEFKQAAKELFHQTWKEAYSISNSSDNKDIESVSIPLVKSKGKQPLSKNCKLRLRIVRMIALIILSLALKHVLT